MATRGINARDPVQKEHGDINVLKIVVASMETVPMSTDDVRVPRGGQEQTARINVHQRFTEETARCRASVRNMENVIVSMGVVLVLGNIRVICVIKVSARYKNSENEILTNVLL